ncbi:MAG: FAD binding domain-containing protein [Acidimicrobiia bacterium]|nr:FAD binding domain-containing protein [Acidimicrobiia bacterium]MDH4305942.1 FAD binding domain-containing protein [Acidimicrobiia bacterium]MDH5295135.1 FAD binding domain-containing protein [Acidimicrobiia bacterium]
MKPAAFVYERPSSIAEAVQLLSEADGEAKVLAGGQSLVPLMAFRLVSPSMLVDIGAIAELGDIDSGPDTIRIGAGVTHRRAELALGPVIPLVAVGLRELGHVAIRNVGTVGGSLAHADPASEWGALALALDASISVTGPAGERSVGADRFFLDWMQPDLMPGEIVTGLHIPKPSSMRWGFVEIARRRGDFALAGAAVNLGVADGVIATARVGILGGGVTPLRAHTLEAALTGMDLVGAAEVAEAVDADVDPLDDQHGPARYKRRLARVVCERAIRQAAEAA